LKKTRELRNLFVEESPKMNIFQRRKLWFFLAFMCLLLSFVQISVAQDHLFLTGIVRSFDSNSGTIRIDVTSEGCKGLREFKEPDSSKADTDLVGKRIHFSIDSAVCERGRIHNILAR
jgi:hypothetical protein